MHALRLLHRIIRQACPQVHAVRLKALMASVGALLVGRQMSLSGLGRRWNQMLGSNTSIKRVDRLVGNRHLQSERHALYKTIATLECLAKRGDPVIILDWSDMREDRSWQLLRAARSGGRPCPGTLRRSASAVGVRQPTGEEALSGPHYGPHLEPGCCPIFE